MEARDSAWESSRAEFVNAPDTANASIAYYRRLLYGAHAGLALLAVLAFTSQISFPNRAYAFFPRAGSGFVYASLPALLPYIVSVMTSKSWVVKSRWHIYAFLAVLVVGGIAAAGATVDAFDWHLGGLALFGIYVAQTFVYMIAAGNLLLTTN